MTNIESGGLIMKTPIGIWLSSFTLCLVSLTAQADPLLVEDWTDATIENAETISSLSNLGTWYAFVDGTARWELTTEGCADADPCDGTYAHHLVPPYEEDHTNSLYYGIAGPFEAGMTINLSFDYVSSNRDAGIFLLGLTDGESEISPFAPWWDPTEAIQLLADGVLDDSSQWMSMALSTTLTSDYDAIAFVVVMGGSSGLRGIDNINVSTVPEPATLALFGLGLAGIGFSRRKKA